MASGEVVFGYAALSCWECAVFGGVFLFVWLVLVVVVFGGCFCLFGLFFVIFFPEGFYDASQYISLSCVSIVWERFYNQ